MNCCNLPWFWWMKWIKCIAPWGIYYLGNCFLCVNTDERICFKGTLFCKENRFFPLVLLHNPLRKQIDYFYFVLGFVFEYSIILTVPLPKNCPLLVTINNCSREENCISFFILWFVIWKMYIWTEVMKMMLTNHNLMILKKSMSFDYFAYLSCIPKSSSFEIFSLAFFYMTFTLC